MNRGQLQCVVVVLFGMVTMPLLAQPEQDQPTEKKKEFGKKDFFFGGGMNQRHKLVAKFDKDGDGRLNEEERKPAREFIKKERANNKGGFGGKKGFGGFDFGADMAKALIKAIDDDTDGKVSLPELKTGIKKFFADADMKKAGTLDESQLAEAINGILPAPPGFPKGGFGGFGPGNGIAGEILKRADSKKKGSVTLEDLLAAAESAFKDRDKEKSGSLDQAAMAASIGELLPKMKFDFKGGKGGPGREPAKPGPKVVPADVKSYPNAKFYDVTVLRTIFIEFDNTKDWEAEMADFYHTDVEIPATVTVDGKKFPNVGVRFRGNSSYFMVPAGYKRSLNLTFDFVDSKQRVHGYRATNLLNCADDPSCVHSVLYCNLARKYLPVPQANFAKVVINGESWGIYVNQQHFNKDFLQENYQTTKGARWRVPGHPGANAGLAYLGDNLADYKSHYEIKSKDDEKDWKALVELCRVLTKTPTEKLEEAIRPMLDIEGALWFLALDNATINDDGYWTRASDYSIYRDAKGKFHLSPHDTNEAFMPMGGKGGKGGFGKGGFGKGEKQPKGGGFALDPLVGLKNSATPLYRLLHVPALREKYFDNLRTIANNDLDWNKLKPTIDQYRKLIEEEIERDTRKLYPLADFKAAHADTPDAVNSRHNLRAFADGRRNYLLNYPGIKKEEAK